MNTHARDDLEKRREAIRQEISTLDEAIIDIASPAVNGAGGNGELQKLKSARETRERELGEVEAELARG
ncbi:MAG: hypothetical protein EOO15_22425 [Chitinophagaceae bacterium]|jgi:hypothetical protein|nr:MAG: hypothetical protein EOO15_22425 [Chitinophagaceae bacterium]